MIDICAENDCSFADHESDERIVLIVVHCPRWSKQVLRVTEAYCVPQSQREKKYYSLSRKMIAEGFKKKLDELGRDRFGHKKSNSFSRSFVISGNQKNNEGVG